MLRRLNPSIVVLGSGREMIVFFALLEIYVAYLGLTGLNPKSALGMGGGVQVFI